jgi:hypothetical protein
VVPVLHQLERCCTTIGSGGANNLLEPRVSECLQFLRGKTAGKLKDYSLFGIITTQTISQQHCTLDTDSKSLPLDSFCNFSFHFILFHFISFHFIHPDDQYSLIQDMSTYI